MISSQSRLTGAVLFLWQTHKASDIGNPMRIPVLSAGTTDQTHRAQFYGERT